MRNSKPTKLAENLVLFNEKLILRKKFVKQEFQAYGLELAKELKDWKNRSLYIRLAKSTNRQLLEKARYFVKDHPPHQIREPYKLFMWKLKELKNPPI